MATGKAWVLTSQGACRDMFIGMEERRGEDETVTDSLMRTATEFLKMTSARNAFFLGGFLAAFGLVKPVALTAPGGRPNNAERAVQAEDPNSPAGRFPRFFFPTIQLLACC